MPYLNLTYGHGVITLKFKNREPIILRDKDMITQLTVDLCEALHRAFPDTAKSKT